MTGSDFFIIRKRKPWLFIIPGCDIERENQEEKDQNIFDEKDEVEAGSCG